MTTLQNTPLSQPAHAPPLVNLGSLAGDMVYRLPGCADLMIRKTLQDVAGDLCRMTGIFRVAVVVTFDDDDVAPINVPYSASIDAVLSVVMADVELRPDVYTLRDGDPPTITLLDGLILPSDDDVQTATITLKLTPRSGCEDYPDWFLTRCGAGIVSGALSRLFAMSKRPWSDPTQANMEGTRYQNALNAAALYVRRGGLGAADLHCRSSVPWV